MWLIGVVHCLQLVQSNQSETTRVVACCELRDQIFGMCAKVLEGLSNGAGTRDVIGVDSF